MSLRIPPNPIFRTHRPKQNRIPIPPLQRLQPVPTHALAIHHQVPLHAVEPALRVLVPVALDPHRPVDNHELDMVLALRRQRAGLVFGDVPVIVQPGARGRGKGGVEGRGDYRVRAALAGEEFSLLGLA